MVAIKLLPERLSAVPIFSRLGRRVILTGQLPDTTCPPLASESLRILPSGDAAYTNPLALSAIGEEWVIRYVPSSEPIPGGEKVHSRCPFRASSANVRP